MSVISASDVNNTDTGSDIPVEIDIDSNPTVIDDGDASSNAITDDIDNTVVVDSDSDYKATDINLDEDHSGESCDVIVIDDKGNAISNESINFIIDDVNYTAKTDNNGVVKLVLSQNSGKSTAAASSQAGNNIEKRNLNICQTVISKNIVKYYKGSAKYTATFYAIDGSPLANTYVRIAVNGKIYKVKTDDKGLASLSINRKPGKYNVVATNPDTGYQRTTTFKILKTISAKNISKVRQDSRMFYAKFYKKNGKVLAKRYVKFRINGKTFKAKTNAKGVAGLSLKSLKKGTYKITSYNGDGLKTTNKIKVYNRVGSSLTSKNYSFLKYSAKTVKVRLLNKLGYAPGKGKTIKFKINGKNYYRHTTKNGYASLKLPTLKVGTYSMKCTFAGNAYYKASKATEKVEIHLKSSSNPYGTGKTAYLSIDNIHSYSKDLKILNDISAMLKNSGWKTKIVGVGPSSHYLQRSALKNGVWFCLYGGACAATLKETANNKWFREPLVKHNSRTVIGFLPPSGDIRKGGKYSNWLPRAWDDDFSPKSFKGLANPAQYLTDHAIPFMYANNAKEMVAKFLAGGDNKEACTKNWKFVTVDDSSTTQSSTNKLQSTSLLNSNSNSSLAIKVGLELGKIINNNGANPLACMLNIDDVALEHAKQDVSDSTTMETGTEFF